MVKDTPALVLFWMAPPVQVPALEHAPPLPVMTRPPLAPVLFSTTPLTAPLLLADWKVTLLAEIVVLAMLIAAPVVLVTELPLPCTLTVPPPAALKPVPVVVAIARPPLMKLMVAPVLEVNVTAADAPVLSALLAPLKLTLPAFRLSTSTPVQVPVQLRLPLSVTVPPAAPLIWTSLPALALVIVPP